MWYSVLDLSSFFMGKIHCWQKGSALRLVSALNIMQDMISACCLQRNNFVSVKNALFLEENLVGTRFTVWRFKLLKVFFSLL